MLLLQAVSGLCAFAIIVLFISNLSCSVASVTKVPPRSIKLCELVPSTPVLRVAVADVQTKNTTGA